MAVKFGSILEPNNPNTTAIAKTVHLSGARSVPTYEDLNNIIPTVLSPSFDPATGTIDTKDAIGQVWYVASENKYYKLSNIRITGDKPPFTPVTTWENFATSVVSSQEQWIHDYIASGVSTQTVLGYDPQGGSSTANNIYFTDTDRITFLTGGKYFKLDASNGSDDVNNPALIVTESTLTKQVSNIYTNDIDPLWDAATALNNNVEVLYNTLSTVNTDLQNTKSTVNNIITYINNDIAGYINDLYSKVGTVTANATWSGIIGDTTTQSGNLPKGTVKAIVGDTNDYVVQFGTNQVDLQNVIRDDNNNELSRANILVGKNVVTKKQQAIVYTTSRDVSTNKIVSMDELTINPNSIYLGNQDTTTFTARDNLSITPGVISMYAGTNMNIQLGTKSENHNINIIPDSTNALYGATFTNLPLNVEALNFKNGTTLTPFDDAVNDIINNKVYTVNININNKSRILTTIDPGELVVYHATSSNGVIIRTKPPSTGNIYQLQLLATNARASYQYNFPLTSGTVALESYVDTAITNLATNFTNIAGDLQEQITDNYNELDDKIDAVDTRVDTTNTNLSNHEKKIATVSEYGHVMLGTKTVISNNFVCIGTHTNGSLVFAIDTELNATSGQPLKNSVITAELAKKATVDALTTGLATKVDKDMTSVTGREMIVSLANGTDTMSGLGIHDGNVIALGNGVGDAVVANGLGVDVATGISYLYSDNTEYNLTELVKTTIPGIQNTLSTKADSTTVTTELAKKADKATTLVGYGITDAYTKSAVDTALATKADKATTLAGYGIIDAYTKTSTDTALAKKVDTTTLTTELAKKADKATTLSGYGITDAYTKTATDTALATKADKATTLEGYGITDAYTSDEVDTELAKKADTTTVNTELAKKADKATTLSGYGITDAYTKTATDTALAKKADKATTLAGYGITDAYTSDEVDTALAKKADSATVTTELAKKANKATTLEGYGITDAYTKTATDTALAKKADKATTLAGYGITDAYTKTAVDTELAKKADTTTLNTELAKKANKATTLEGYGITDAYTKTELDGKLVGAMRFKGNVDTYADLPSTGQVHGDMWNVLDTGDNYAWNSDTSSWDNLSGVVNLADYAKTADVTSAISTAVSNHNSSATAHSTLFAAKADKATTLAGYGITDAYTKTAVDTELAKKATTEALNTGLATKVNTTTFNTELAKKADKTTTLAGYGITDAYTSEEVDIALAKKADSATVTTELAKKANKATTLEGYGITDAYTSEEVDTALAKKADTTTVNTELAKKADSATTLAGYGITDAYTKTATDTALAKKADKATTLAGYGITDAYTTTTVDTALAKKADSTTVTTELAKKADKATTLEGYGITDAYTSDEVDTALAKKADSATTLAGYGITDAYTKTATDTALAKKADSATVTTELAKKADKATTLAGYGITDAYTKTTVDTELAKKANKATTLSGYGITDALSTTVTTQQTVASSVKVNNTLYATTIYENNTSLANKYAAKSHTHVISDITNLQTTLDGKASTTDIETLTDNLATEVSNREAADTNLQASITTNATNITTLQGKVSTLETNALSKTATAQQSVASEVKFNGGVRADSIKTLYGTSLFTTVSAKGFDFTGIYRMFPYQSTTAFFESTVAGGSNTLLRATTIYENGVSLADTYAKKADVYTKTETDSAIVAVISNKNKSVWSPEFTTTDYDSTEEAYKWIIGVYTIPEYSNELPIVQIYEDSSATGTAKPTGATELELVQPKIAVIYDSTGTKAAVTAYFNFESADLPIVAYRYKAQIWFPGMSVTTETGGYPISNVKVKVLTQAEYDAITEKDEDTIYFISDAE